MRRRSKDFIKVSDYTSLDMLIKTLVAIRDNLDEKSEPEIKLSGDDIFGRHITIGYLREISEEEANLEARYQNAESMDDTSIDGLTQALNEIPSQTSDVRQAA